MAKCARGPDGHERGGIGRIGVSHNRFLLVTRAGAQSLHPHWLAPDGARNFDLFVSAHSEDVPHIEGDGLFFEHRPGRKVAGYAAFLRDHEALWRAYDHVALFDDDLMTSAQDLSRMFEIAREYDLKIAQPALTRDSFFTYAALLRHPGFTLRYMTYVEMMCPVFRSGRPGRAAATVRARLRERHRRHLVEPCCPIAPRSRRDRRPSRSSTRAASAAPDPPTALAAGRIYED